MTSSSLDCSREGEQVEIDYYFGREQVEIGNYFGREQIANLRSQAREPSFLQRV